MFLQREAGGTEGMDALEGLEAYLAKGQPAQSSTKLGHEISLLWEQGALGVGDRRYI